jgi:hypothetical protein
LTSITSGWEALRGDPLSWLLDDARPNHHWRALVELVKRPISSPAVQRAKGGANVAEPVASLLRDLQPNGGWATNASWWTPFVGPAWRLIAAVQWGSDPDDPRLHAAAERLLETVPGEGGFARNARCEPEPWLTARGLQALAELGWTRHPRFLEGLAWLEESDVGWGPRPAEWAETAVAVLAVLGAGDFGNRTALRERSVGVLRSTLTAAGGSSRLGHPNLHRTDLAEILCCMAMADVPVEPPIARGARRLQRLQLEGARWARTVPIPTSLPVPDEHRPSVGQPSRWVSLHATVAIMHYAVDANLPRMFPQKPGSPPL